MEVNLPRPCVAIQGLLEEIFVGSDSKSEPKEKAYPEYVVPKSMATTIRWSLIIVACLLEIWKSFSSAGIGKQLITKWTNKWNKIIEQVNK